MFCISCKLCFSPIEHIYVCVSIVYNFRLKMTRKCCVSACTKDAKHLFKLPEILTTSWLKVINRPGWTPSRNSRICSQHFSPNDIVNYRFLRRGAEPRGSIIALFSNSMFQSPSLTCVASL